MQISVVSELKYNDIKCAHAVAVLSSSGCKYFAPFFNRLFFLFDYYELKQKDIKSNDHLGLLPCKMENLDKLTNIYHKMKENISSFTKKIPDKGKLLNNLHATLTIAYLLGKADIEKKI